MTSINDSAPVTSVDFSADYRIDGMLDEADRYKWGDGTGVIITYSFPTSKTLWDSNYGAGDNEPSGLSAFSAAQQAGFKAALQSWADVANITFTQVAETKTDVGDIRAANSSVLSTTDAAAWAYYPFPGDPSAGDVWVDPAYSPNNSPSLGSFGFEVLVHELGHVLGLAHSFDETDLGVPFNDAHFLKGAEETTQYTIMSYSDYDMKTGGIITEYNSFSSGYAQGPMLYDILAIQYMYGANMTTRLGDTVYKFGASDLRAIWDAGGIDTLDASNQSKAVIDLHDGAFSSIGAGNIDNIAIAFNAIIENAIGGSGADTITGNDVANKLEGRGGDDTLFGLDGDDFLDGGTGADKMDGADGNDIYVVDNLKDSITDSSGDDDEIQATISINITSYDGIDHATLLGTAGLNVTGNGNDNKLTGNAGANTLDGGQGSDELAGGKGNDLYLVDNEFDEITEAAGGGVDTVRAGFDFDLSDSGQELENLELTGTGNFDGKGTDSANAITGNSGDNQLDGDSGNDILIGNDGNDTLEGGNGNDTLTGGKGDDIYIVDSAADKIIETLTLAADGGVDTVKAGLTYSLVGLANIDNLTLESFAGKINGTGNALINVINGNDDDNKLDGAAGDDELHGLGGNDTLIGGTGNDLLFGGAGSDNYFVDSLNDKVDEEGNAVGNDTITASVLLTGPIADVENYFYTGSAAWTFTGSATGGTIHGGSGNDTLTGLNTNTQLFGNAGNDKLFGGDADDVLDGGAGTDEMTGGKGDDTYVVDSALDKIFEDVGGGSEDIVKATISIDLEKYTEIEMVTLVGTAVLNASGTSGVNALIGNDGANLLDGRGGADSLFGGNGNDTFVVDDDGDSVAENVNEGVDLVTSKVDFDLLSKGANIENLTLLTGALNGTGNTLANIITGNGANNNLDGGDNNDTLIGAAGNDTLDGGIGADTMTGGVGSDNYVVDNVGDKVVETANTPDIQGFSDTVRSSITFSLAGLGFVENLTLTGALGTENLNGTGNALANSIVGNDGNNLLDGGAGIDSLFGKDGNDTYIIDNAADAVFESANEGIDSVISSALLAGVISEIENYTYTGSAAWTFTGTTADNILKGGSGIDTLSGGDGKDQLFGNGGNDVLDGGDDDDLLDGGLGADKMTGGLGADTYIVDNVGDQTIETGADIDLVKASVTYALAANLDNLILTGAAAINGTGNTLDNELTGNIAANSLDGLGGADKMAGAAGNDTYTVDDAGDTVTESLNEGTADLIKSKINFDLSTDGANVENLTFIGAGNFIGTGNNLANIITGGSGKDTLDGMEGNDILTGGDGDDSFLDFSGTDTLIGGKGNDTYTYVTMNDKIIELAGQGIDEIRTNSNFSLAAFVNVENLTLWESPDNTDATGNALDNVIHGNMLQNIVRGDAGNDTLFGEMLDDKLFGGAGNDILDGGSFDDTLDGGAGNDTYIVDSANDIVLEALNAGTDTVKSGIAFSLAALTNFENLTLTGSVAIDGTGNALNNELIGNDKNNKLAGDLGNDTLDGGKGDDDLQGGLGNDTYLVDSVGDKITEAAGAGTGIDLIKSLISFDLAASIGDNVENLTLLDLGGDIKGSGNALNNIITGNIGKNELTGGAGTDALVGGKGDDTYNVDSITDKITELLNEGVDQVKSSVTFSLAAIANVENLTLTGALNIDGIGNTLNNIVTGNAGVNKLDGAAGNDALFGGDDNDTLLGGAGNDTLDGESGDDRMEGGVGDDKYIVDVLTDVVVEAANSGTDTIETAITFSLFTNGANVENLTLTGTSVVDGTGNILNNTITGNDKSNKLDGGDGNDTLDGGKGADALIGGKGNDIFIVDDAGDMVDEKTNEGIDLVKSTVDFNLGNISFVENLTLTGTGDIFGKGDGFANVIIGNGGKNELAGGSGNDTLDGGTGDDTLDGGIGNDTITGGDGDDDLTGGDGIDNLIGGKGDDVYHVDSLIDKITELLGQGIDRVESSIDFSLAALANVDNLTLTGTASKGTGNALANLILGNASANTLDGGLGIDTLRGKAGNDTYMMDNLADAIDEEANTDTGDTVVTSVLLAASITQIENYTYTGSGAWTFTGTAADNVLKGGTGIDTLHGGAGNDTLDGGTGADKLFGGADNDTYIVDNIGDKVDEEANTDTNDTVKASVTFTLGAQLENLILTGTVAINATGNGLDNELTGNIAANILDGLGGADKMTGGAGNDTYFVDDAGDTVTELGGGGTADLIKSSIDFSLAALGEVENLTLLTGATTGTGNGANNIITGNAAANTLDGGAGNDTLIGGDGGDTYVVDNAADKITELAGQGNDHVNSSVTYSLAALANVENLHLTGAASINGTGNTLDNLIDGNTGNNTLDGGAGNDKLAGGDGNDTLLGGLGNDTLIGGKDDDIFTGGSGRDILDFNAETDAGTGLDRVTDFTKGATGDVLDVHDLLSGFAGYTGSNAFSGGYLEFLNNQGGSGHDTVVRYDADGGGDNYQILVTLTNVTLTQTDTANFTV